MTKEDYYGWVYSSPHDMLQAIFDSAHFIQGKEENFYLKKKNKNYFWNFR